MRSANVYKAGSFAGRLEETPAGYLFTYAPAYCANPDALPVSLTLPVRTAPYLDKVLPAFFDGLIPEGWLLDVAVDTWKADPRDRMGLLLAYCADCIGDVSVKADDGE